MKTFKGKQITIDGVTLKKGDKAPDFRAIDVNFEEVRLKEFNNDYILLNVVPSLDTPVCDLQTKTINEEILKKEDIDMKVITISNDLPYAQERWSEREELEGITVLSDYLFHEFGDKYGLFINELGLLARCVLILNSKKEIIYSIHSNEMSQHLNYDEILDFINTLPGK